MAIFNPFAEASAQEIQDLLVATCTDGLDGNERAQFVSEVRALIPALVELRDAKLLDLNARTIVDHATLDGLMRLSSNSSLSSSARERCVAMRDHLLADAVHQELMQRTIGRKLH